MQGKYFLDKAICRRPPAPVVRLASEVWKSPQVVPRDVASGLGRALELRSFQAGSSLFRLHSSSIGLIVQSLTYPWVPSSNGSPLASRKEEWRKEGRKEAAKRRRKRAEKRKARLSCICSVAGGRALNREREREKRNIIALFRPDASPRRGGRNKYYRVGDRRE